MNTSGYKSVLQPLQLCTQPLYVWIYFRVDAIKILLFSLFILKEKVRAELIRRLMD